MLYALENPPHSSTTQQLTSSDNLGTLAYILLLLRVVEAGVGSNDGYDDHRKWWWCDDSMIMMTKIDLLHTMTAGTGPLLYFNLPSHSPLSFLHNGPVVWKRGNTYPLLELARLDQVVFPFCIVVVVSTEFFCCLSLSSLFLSPLSFVDITLTVGYHPLSRVIWRDGLEDFGSVAVKIWRSGRKDLAWSWP